MEIICTLTFTFSTKLQIWGFLVILFLKTTYGGKVARWLYSHVKRLYSVILKVYCLVTFSLTFLIEVLSNRGATGSKWSRKTLGLQNLAVNRKWPLNEGLLPFHTDSIACIVLRCKVFKRLTEGKASRSKGNWRPCATRTQTSANTL